jgi:hypothetical protein
VVVVVVVVVVEDEVVVVVVEVEGEGDIYLEEICLPFFLGKTPLLLLSEDLEEEVVVVNGF